MTEVRFPVADAGRGRLWTLHLERLNGQPGIWPHPRAVDASGVDPQFDDALQTAWRWACAAAEPGAPEPSIRWQIFTDEGGDTDPRASGGSVGAAAAVGLAYLLGIANKRRGIDPHSALSATVDENGILGSVTELPAKLRGAHTSWHRLVVSPPDAATAQDATQGEKPKIVVAENVREAAARVAKPMITRRSSVTAATAVVVAFAVASWFLISHGVAANEVASVNSGNARAFQMSSTADGLASTDPSTALRLAVAAVKLAPSSVDARAALIQLAQEDPRIKDFLGPAGEPEITRLGGATNGAVVVSADSSGTVRSWHPSCAKCPAQVISRGSAVADLAVAPQGELIAVARGSGIAVKTPSGGSADGWPHTLRVGGVIDAVAVNTDASQIAAGTSTGGVYVWTANHSTPQFSVIHNAGPVSAMTFLPDGHLVTGTAAIASEPDQDLSVWSTTSRDLVRTVLASPHATTLINAGVRALAVVGNSLIIGETYLEVRPLDSLDKQRTIGVGDTVTSLLPLDDAHVLVGTSSSLQMSAAPIGGKPSVSPVSYEDIDIKSGIQTQAPLQANLNSLTPSVAAGPGGTVLTGTTSGVITQWSLAQGPAPEIVRVIPDAHDQDSVLASRVDGSVVSFNAATHKTITLIAANQHGVPTALAEKGDVLLVGYLDGTVLRVNRMNSATPTEFMHLEGKVYALTFSPSGRELAVADSGQVEIHEAATGRLLRILPGRHSGAIHDISFDPTGTFVASSGAADDVLIQKVNGKVVKKIALVAVGLLDWLPDGSLVVGDGLGNLYRFRPTQSVPVSPLVHLDSSNILGGALDPAHRLVIAGSADQTAVLFDLESDRVMGVFPTLDGTRSGSFAAAAWSASFTTNGRYAVFGTMEGHLQTVTSDIPRLIASACAAVPDAPSPYSLDQSDLLAAREACS